MTRVIQIFDKYPLLTARKICQLRFLKKCLENPNMDEYFASRDDKYADADAIMNSKPFISVAGSVYFNTWVAGFVEAEGCFSARASGTRSFSLSLKNEPFLIEEIKTLFNIPNPVRKMKGSVYIFEIYKHDILIGVAKFFEDYPLIGEKRESYMSFFKHIK